MRVRTKNGKNDKGQKTVAKENAPCNAVGTSFLRKFILKIIGKEIEPRIASTIHPQNEGCLVLNDENIRN